MADSIRDDDAQRRDRRLHTDTPGDERGRLSSGWRHLRASALAQEGAATNLAASSPGAPHHLAEWTVPGLDPNGGRIGDGHPLRSEALVVEDHQPLRDLLSRVLTRRGHAVTTCADGAEAWDRLQQHRFGLVLLDVGLPRLDGLTILRRLRAQPGGDLPVVLVVTGRTQRSDLVEILAAGASDYLPKPFDPATLDVRLAVVEQRQREQGVRRASEERLQLALDAAQAVVWDWEPEAGTFAWQTWHDGAIIARRGSYDDYLAWIHPDDRARVRIATAEALTTGGRWTIEYRVVEAGGDVRWLAEAGRVMGDGIGQPRLLHAVALDVTAWQEAEAALQASETALHESEQRFQRAFVSAPIGMALVGLDGRLLVVNQSLCDLLGYTEQELLARTFQDITHPDDLPTDQQEIRRLLASTIPAYVRESHLLRQDGRVVTARIACSAVRDLAEAPRYLVSQVVDMTEIKEAERRQQEFVANASHELRTPVTAIMGFGELLAEETEGLPERSQHFLEIIQENSRRLATLVDELLDLSRIDAGQLQLRPVRCALLPLIEGAMRAVEAQAAAREQVVHLALPDDLPALWADPIRTAQVLTNLLANATKYTPAGGTITVSAAREDDLLRVEVADTGVGLSPTQQERLFTRFYRVPNAATRSTEGSGLGLAIARDLVMLQGGTIDVRSSLGAGSTFSITIPIAPDGDATGDPPATGAAAGEEDGT